MQFVAEQYGFLLGVIVVSLAVYGAAYRFLYWQVQRQQPHLPGIVLSLLGGSLGAALGARVGGGQVGWQLAGAAVFTFVVLYLVVKTTTPSTVRTPMPTRVPGDRLGST